MRVIKIQAFRSWRKKKRRYGGRVSGSYRFFLFVDLCYVTDYISLKKKSSSIEKQFLYFHDRKLHNH